MKRREEKEREKNGEIFSCECVYVRRKLKVNERKKEGRKGKKERERGRERIREKGEEE